jgi:FlaA1/EpsC-like NDP-sugar epimerase
MHEPRRAEMASESNELTITLGLLTAIESDSMITQRKLSLELGIALGLTNTYLKRCVRKGWIKINQVPMRRYAYYLTPHGFNEKVRLTGDFLSTSLRFFRRARREASELFGDHKKRGLTRIVLVGAGDLAEVAALSAIEVGVEVVGIVDPGAMTSRCAGRPIFRSIDALKSYLADNGVKVDTIVTTAIADAPAMIKLANEVTSRLNIKSPPARLPVTQNRVVQSDVTAAGEEPFE